MIRQTLNRQQPGGRPGVIMIRPSGSQPPADLSPGGWPPPGRILGLKLLLISNVICQQQHGLPDRGIACGKIPRFAWGEFLHQVDGEYIVTRATEGIGVIEGPGGLKTSNFVKVQACTAWGIQGGRRKPQTTRPVGGPAQKRRRRVGHGGLG